MADFGQLNKIRKIPSFGNQKLLKGEKVEVRSIEDGCEGSWHAGAIVECRSRGRVVQYDNLLCDDKSAHLVELLEVSSMFDGILNSSETADNYRSWIRPNPQVRERENERLHYGLCVDAYYDNAWWEGVIFDFDDGSENRKVFFPDAANEKSVETKNLRITYEWDAVTNEWKFRGNWLFFTIMKNLEMDIAVPISLKLLWSKLRDKNYDQIVSWTSLAKQLWKKLMEVVSNDHLKMTIEEFPIRNFFEKKYLERNGLNPKPNFASFQEDVAPLNSFRDGGFMTRKEDGMAMDDAWDKSFVPPSIDHVMPVQPNFQSDINSNFIRLSECNIFDLDTPPDEFTRGFVSNYNLRSNVNLVERDMMNHSDLEMNSSDVKGKQFWYPAVSIVNLKPEFCPSSMNDYLKSNNNPTAIENVRNHLFYLGWDIECTRKKNIFRVRYTSPQGKRLYSLRDVCRYFLKHEVDNLLTSIEPMQKRTVSLNESTKIVPFGNVSSNPLLNESNKIVPFGNLSSNPLVNEPIKRTELTGKGESHRGGDALTYDDTSVEPEYCPESVFLYVKYSKNPTKKAPSQKELTMKVRKHLKAMGWNIWFKIKKNTDEWRYDSPTSKKTYYSLMSACRAIVEGDELNSFNTSEVQAQGVICIADPKDHSSDQLPLFNVDSIPQNFKGSSMLWEYRDDEFNKHQKKKKKKKNDTIHSEFFPDDNQLHEEEEFANEMSNGETERYNSRLSKKSLSKKRRLLDNVKSSSDGNNLGRVLRSSKRISQTVPSNSSQHPRTVLSWLIDNNVVSSRKIIYYRRKKDHHPIARGRITRDGIKCDCCMKVFTLSGFEAHAGSNFLEPTANLFLEDGRSLVECQMEILRNKCETFTKEPIERARKEMNQNWNDHICSICHFGGKIILCDHCPSSFHAACLNLQKIPKGRWYCPSCCCGICGENHFDENMEHFTDKSVLGCHQCERQYHVHCIRGREMVMLDVRPKEEWFCSKACGKIYWGLQQLLGKPILVGHDNLTWTLMKPSDYEASELDECDVVTMAENFSKLSNAVEVMHECFEPVEEPQTRRDIVKDVIFCRSSFLNRLDFRGFYTVLLERNDELISVATLRVHGSKVAEIPFIGTRFQHRRFGMCRILLNEIEKNLVELEVDKLVLPASESVLNTWTNSFGFSTVTISEKSEFLGYTFLDFQDARMCQKRLRKHPSHRSPLFGDMNAVVRCEPPRSTQGNNVRLDLERNTSGSDVFQVEGSENADQEAQDTDSSDQESEPRNNLKAIYQIQEKVGREKCDGSARLYKRKKAMHPNIFSFPRPLTQC